VARRSRIPEAKGIDELCHVASLHGRRF